MDVAAAVCEGVVAAPDGQRLGAQATGRPAERRQRDAAAAFRVADDGVDVVLWDDHFEDAFADGWWEVEQACWCRSQLREKASCASQDCLTVQWARAHLDGG